ncbi:winged helix DNA-binding protein [Sphingomonas arvum]|uniref:winged helix DNA-binding protein n=1 Tax=Sphingomonas arvum TaxID=2992113 RepID=UPI0038B38237
MLDIFVCDLVQQRNPTSVVGRSAGIPHSTALRWLAALERRRLIKREPDRTDARRVYVTLTNEGFTKMRLWMESELLQGL